MRSHFLTAVVGCWLASGALAQPLDRPLPPARELPRGQKGMEPLGPFVIDKQETGPVAVPEPSEKALRYYHSGKVLWAINLAWGIVVPCLFLFTGFSARIRNLAWRIGRWWFFTVGIYFL